MLSTLKRVIKRITPGFVVRGMNSTAARRLRHYGRSHYCPVCQSHVRAFIDYHSPYRVVKAEECPVCGSHRRHRLIWLYLQDQLQVETRPRFALLHIAPEQSLAERFRRMPNVEYLSGDLKPRAMVQMDITAIQYPDHSFDAILCSHVLEYIEADRRAMGELFRVLRPGGWAILQAMVDLNRETTLEDPTVTSFEDRRRVFGHYEHIRLYGRDYVDRLRSCGFEVTVEQFGQNFTPEESERLGLDRDLGIYVCRKPPVAAG